MMVNNMYSILKIEDYEFLTKEVNENISVYFSTAKGDLNFNKALEEGRYNLQRLKEWFDAKEVVYLSQVHGSDVAIYNGDNSLKNSDGDGIVTDNKDTIIGVFTADCVPVILVDPVKNIISAVHSGWKGTFMDIAAHAVDKMVDNYNSRPEDIKVFIGPHNRVCCYEVSEDLIRKFKENEIFSDGDISEGRNLNLAECIKIGLRKKGIKEENITDLEICTYCNKEHELFSYRHEGQQYGRMFSFIMIKQGMMK